MLLRIWKVALTPGKAVELEAFAQTTSLPMFQEQPGCRSVFFTRTETACVTVTVWDSERSVEQLEASDRYRQVVRTIEHSGILGDSTIPRHIAYTESMRIPRCLGC